MILVTGAAGLSGSIIVRELGRQPNRDKALVRSRSKAPWIEELPSVQLLEGDMALAGTLGDALRGVDRVLMISSADERLVETQCKFIDACKRAGVKHVVKLSGKESAVGFDPERFRFTRMHKEIENYLEGSGMSWTHLRPSQFMQVYFREVGTIVARNTFFLPMEESRLAPIDIEDIAKIAALVLLGVGACLPWRNRPGTHLIACADRILAPVENVIEMNVATNRFAWEKKNDLRAQRKRSESSNYLTGP